MKVSLIELWMLVFSIIVAVSLIVIAVGIVFIAYIAGWFRVVVDYWSEFWDNYLRGGKPDEQE